MGQVEVIIPCYNESGSLPTLLSQCELVYKESGGDVSFIIVNNGSKDTSEKILESARPHNASFRTINLLINRGYGGGILAGLAESTAPFIGWTHADLQTPLTDILRTVQLLTNEFSFVKGYRHKRSFGDSFFSFGMSFFESMLFGTLLIEINAQPTLFHRSFLEQLEVAPTDFSLDLYTLLTAKRAKMDLKRLLVDFNSRLHGESHWNHGFQSRMKFIKRTISYSLQLRKKSYAHN